MKISNIGEKIFFCSILLIILINFCSCNTELYSSLPQSAQKENTAKKGIVLSTEKREYPFNIEEIKIIITNYSNKTYEYVKEDGFSFEYYENGKWVNYPLKKDAYSTYDYWYQELNPYESAEQLITISLYFDNPLKKGYYRIHRKDLKEGHLISNAFLIK